MASDKSNSLNAPDAFQLQAYSLMDRLARNPKPLRAVAVLVLVVIIGGFSFKFISDKKTGERKEALATIDLAFDNELKSISDQRQALEAQRDALVAKQPAPEAGKPLTETPEMKALSDKIAALKPDHNASAAQYAEFYKANSKSPEGLIAGLRFANNLRDKGDIAQARQVLEAIAQDGKGLVVLQLQAYLGLIAINEDQGDFDAAVKNADALYGIVGPELKPRALLSKAEALYFKKDFPAAKTALEKIISDHANSAEAEKARGLLALIPA